MRETLNGDPETRQQAMSILRSLIDKIVLHPGARRGELGIELHGQLAAIINLARSQRPGEDLMITMVAEERYPLYRTRRRWVTPTKVRRS